MLKRCLSLIVLSTLFFALSGTALAQREALEMTDLFEANSYSGLGFGNMAKRIAGTYLVETQTTINGNPIENLGFGGFQTLTLGGTQKSVDKGSFMGPGDNLIFPQGLGVWRQVGHRKIAIKSELLGYQSYETLVGPVPPPFPIAPEPDESNYLTVPGRAFAICEVNALVEFDRHFRSASGTFTTTCYCQDPPPPPSDPPEDPPLNGICGPVQSPLDPNAVPFFPPPGLEFGGNIVYTPLTIDR